MKRMSENFHHYIPLLGMLAAGIMAFVFFSYDRVFQFIIVTAMAFGYVVWGLIHHFVHDELSWGTIVEYVCVALLGVVAVYGLVIRG